MSKLMIAMPSDKTPPLYDFFNDELNEKQRQKLLSLFALMLQAPVSVMREPYVKHFTLERYSSLYELRAKSKTLVRIIFTMTPDGDVLFLTPFVKQHRRDTMQALESSLSLLDRMRDGSCSYPGANFLYSYRNLPGYRKPECGNRIYHHGHLYGRDHIRRDWLRPIYGDLSGDTAEVRIFDRASSSGFAGGRVGNACGYPGFSISAPAKCGHLCDERKRCCI